MAKKNSAAAELFTYGLFLRLDEIQHDAEGIKQCGTDQDAGNDVGEPVNTGQQSSNYHYNCQNIHDDSEYLSDIAVLEISAANPWGTAEYRQGEHCV